MTFWKDSMDKLLVSVFIESHPEIPAEIVLDVDTTDLPLHDKQEGRFFHGYYDEYCYLPLYTLACVNASSAENTFCARVGGSPITMLLSAAWRRSKRSWRRYGRRGPR
ncbi:MAG: transposase [Bryobacteraceae bacterium]